MVGGFRKRRLYGFTEASGEAAGVALPAGKTPAPEFGAAEATGDGEAGKALAGEDCGASWDFISSRRNALWPVILRCAYKIDNANVSAKKMPASHVVNFTSTLVVCAPKMFSVTPPPNAAPSPSLLGRCIRITSTMNAHTSTKSPRQRLIRIDIETRNISKAGLEANAEYSASNAELTSVRH